MGFLIAALAIILILCLRISVRIRAGDEIKMNAGIGFIKFNLYPTKTKRLKLKDYSIGRYRKNQSKISGLKLKKSKKTAAKAEKTKKYDTGETDEVALDILGVISKLSRVSSVFLKYFGRYLHIETREIVLIVATGDAASTAVLYGAAIALMQNLYALLVTYGRFVIKPNSDFILEPDYTAAKSSVRLDIKFSFRLWQLIRVAAHTLIEYLRDNDSDSSEPANNNK